MKMELVCLLVGNRLSLKGDRPYSGVIRVYGVTAGRLVCMLRAFGWAAFFGSINEKLKSNILFVVNNFTKRVWVKPFTVGARPRILPNL